MAAPRFEKLSNFRDVAVSVNTYRDKPHLRPGLLFRSARPDEATSADRQRLLVDYGIKTIVDLRTTTEHLNAAKKHSSAAAVAEPAIVPLSTQAISEPIKIPGINYTEINLNGKGFERSLVWQLRYLSLAKVVGLMVLGYRMEAISIIAREVMQPRGLIGLGIDTLDHSGVEIRQVFEVVADQSTLPLMIHCTQGKDRTGIIVLLILLLCGIDVSAITCDYVMSEAELEPEKDERLKEIARIGLDESFASCPPDFPSRMIEYIEEKWGSVEEYLQGLGIEKDKLQTIRSNLKAGDEGHS